MTRAAQLALQEAREEWESDAVPIPSNRILRPRDTKRRAEKFFPRRAASRRFPVPPAHSPPPGL